MLSLLYGIIGVVLESIGKVHQQKSLKSSDNLSQNLFKMYSHIIGVIFFLFVLIFLPYETGLLRDYPILGIIIIVAIARILNQNFELSILKKTKLSYLLPYENLDKIFIVIFGYILYQFLGGTEVSLITMGIVCITFILVLLFSIDIKKLKFPITVILFIIAMAIRAGIMLSTAYILFKYSSVTYGVTQIVLTIIIATLLSLLLRDNFKLLYKQSYTFYKHRLIAVCLGQIGFLLSLLIIETAGIIVASLLGFLAIVAKIISMKIILNEYPSNKQISLSLLVVILIGIGLYFK